MLLVPWWWIVLRSGKRFSLRRAIPSTAGLVALVVAVVIAARYAFEGRLPNVATAEMVATYTAIAGVAYALCEPLLFVAADTLRSRSWRPDRLRDISYGMLTLYAVALGLLAYVLAAHVMPLGRLLIRARTDSGWYGGTFRYISGATIVMLPLVIGTRALLVRVRLAAPRRQAVRSRPMAQPPPLVPIVARPARIISMEVRSSETRDDA